MTPERLVLDEFGPYTETQTVDFEALGADQLFLIHGPTGSGKSTLLDAICFALYGETSGNERGGGEMRSDFAGLDEPTEVTLDFRLGEERYRLRRRPKQTLAKKRGDGTTDKSQKATLYDRSEAESRPEDGRPIANGMRDVNGTVKELLGLESEQFRQVVVLPQGKFRQFLSAGSTEREDILKVLFETGRYERLEEILKEMAGETQEKISRLRDKIESKLEGEGVEDADELEEKRSSVAEALSEAEEKTESLEEQLEEARGALKEAEANREVLDELEEAREEVEKLRDEKEEHEDRTGRLDAARRAAKIGPLKDDLDTRRKEKEAADRAAREAAEALSEAHQELESAKARLEEERERDPRREELRDEKRRLSDAEEDIGKLDEVQEQLAERREEKETLSEELQDEKEEKTSLEETLEEKREALEKRRETASQLGLREKELEEAETLKEKALELKEKKQAAEEAEERLEAAKEGQAVKQEALDRANRTFERLQKERQEAYASVLAEDLTAGDPCPVCGSTEHPNPAEGGHDVPGEAQIEAAREEKNELRSALGEATQEVSDAEADLSAKRADVESLEENYSELSELSREEVEEQRMRAEEALQESQKAAEKAEGLEEAIKDREQKLEEKEEAIEEREEKLDDLESAFDSLESRSDTLREGLPEGVTSGDSLEERMAEVEGELSKLETALEDAEEALQEHKESVAEKKQSVRGRQRQAQQAAETTREAHMRFRRVLEDSEFSGASAFEEARLGEEERESLEERVREFEDHWAAATTRLERAQKEAEDVGEPDVEGAEEKVESVRSELDDRKEEAVELSHELKSIEKSLEEIEDIREELELADERYESVGFLSDVARGKNSQRMSLQRFVLATRLEEVLQVANDHIEHMTQNRYHLLRAEEVRDRRSGAGLDLLVYDAQTGERRPVSTLSGGEGFMTSLSLALGLSDVVQSVSGGRHLETLFIDEGFGSLDQEALNRAMEALSDLRDTGRLVGVISHVSELKQRIPTRLEVEQTHEGSTLSMTA